MRYVNGKTTLMNDHVTFDGSVAAKLRNRLDGSVATLNNIIKLELRGKAWLIADPEILV